RVPPAASAAFGAAYGPRVLPGTYTVKMTKDTATYSTKLTLVPDPRGTHTDAERQAAFDLALKMSGTLTDMSFAVERMNATRLARLRCLVDARAGQYQHGAAGQKARTDRGDDAATVGVGGTVERSREAPRVSSRIGCRLYASSGMLCSSRCRPQSLQPPPRSPDPRDIRGSD